MAEKLSARLELLLKQGLEGQDFWDVCCDHGYLGESALKSGRFRQVHFVDSVPHIIQSLKFRLENNEARFLALRAEELAEPLTGTVVLAGVGGFTIIKILQRWEEKNLLRAQRLVLNPLTHVKELEQFLEVWTSYREVERLFVREREKERQVLVLDPNY